MSLHPIASRRIKTGTKKSRGKDTHKKGEKERVEEKQKTGPAHRLSKSSEKKPYFHVTPDSNWVDAKQ